MVREREKSVVTNLSPQAKETGDEARQATLETQTAVKGEVEFFNELYNAIYSGIQKKTPEIFVIAPEDVAQYISARHKIDTEGTQLDPTLTDTDPTSGGADFSFVLTETKGAELMQIFKNNGQSIEELKTCDGFQARLGGVRLVFFYSGRRPEHDAAKSAARQKTKPAASLPN